jgi:hypothetical protein
MGHKKKFQVSGSKFKVAALIPPTLNLDKLVKSLKVPSSSSLSPLFLRGRGLG